MELLISPAYLAEQCFHVATSAYTLVKPKADSRDGAHSGGLGQLGAEKARYLGQYGCNLRTLFARRVAHQCKKHLGVAQVSTHRDASEVYLLNTRVSDCALQQPRQLFMQKMTDALSSLKLPAHAD